MNFSLPPILMLLVMVHWLLTNFQHSRMSIKTSGKQFPGTVTPWPVYRGVFQLLLNHTTAINNLPPLINNNQAGKAPSRHKQNKFMEDHGFFPGSKPKARQLAKALFGLKTEENHSGSHSHSPHLISMEQLQTVHLDNIADCNLCSVVGEIRF